METYREPNIAGISLSVDFSSDSHSSNKKNHPIFIQVYSPNPWHGELSHAHGISISHAYNGKRLMLHLVGEYDPERGENFRFDSSYFLRKTKLRFKDCSLAYGTFRPATPEDWATFIDMFKTYLNSDIAPLVREFFNKIVGMTAENRANWQALGRQLIQSGTLVAERNDDIHLSPTNEKEIARSKK